MQRHTYIVSAALLVTRATERHFSYFVQAMRKACPRPELSRLLANRTILITAHAVPKLDETTRSGSTGQRREDERRRREEIAAAEIIMKELRALLKKGVTNIVDSSGGAID